MSGKAGILTLLSYRPSFSFLQAPVFSSNHLLFVMAFRACDTPFIRAFCYLSKVSQVPNKKSPNRGQELNPPDPGFLVPKRTLPPVSKGPLTSYVSRLTSYVLLF